MHGYLTPQKSSVKNHFSCESLLTDYSVSCHYNIFWTFNISSIVLSLLCALVTFIFATLTCHYFYPYFINEKMEVKVIELIAHSILDFLLACSQPFNHTSSSSEEVCYIPQMFRGRKKLRTIGLKSVSIQI